MSNRFKKRGGGIFWAALLVLVPAFLEARPFDQIFPYLGEDVKAQVFSESGVIRSRDKIEDLSFLPALSSGINLIDSIAEKNPSFFVESLLVIPHGGRALRVLDAYNALGRVGDLKGRLYRSFTRGADIPLFEEAARLESAARNKPVPDPAPSASLPSSETIYIRLKDVNFGNSYYRADIRADSRGILYSLSNYKAISYLIFTVMPEEKFSANLYLEPLDEGMLVYSIAGTDVSDFIARRIDIPSAISKRLAVFIDWVSAGIKAAR
ncbi:MAG: hypothetical protein LBQ67_01675 [Treponema sp.]|jgi:hypothetical protein|nr:hypothetical protein [Treponema sp.]